MKKHLSFVCFFYFCFSILLLKAQSLQIFNINPNGFPNIEAGFYAFDSKGDQILNLSKSDLKLFENGSERKILYTACPKPSSPQKLSTVLTIDVSGSMANGGLKIAKAAANRYIDAIPSDGSECAITGFMTTNFILHDFSNDKTDLKNSLNYIQPSGNPNFDAAFIDQIFGSLIVAERGKNKRIVIMVTNDIGEVYVEEVIRKANSLNASIYCVVLNKECPARLKYICDKTGGIYFENINNENEAILAYIKILRIAQGAQPCIIEWESKADCNAVKNFELQIPSYSLNASCNYIGSPESQIALNIKPTGIALGLIDYGKAKDTTFQIEAINDDLRILSITSSNPAYTIIDYGGTPPPFTLSKGQKRVLTFRFIQNNNYSPFAEFKIDKENCGNDFFYISSLSPSLKNKTLKITNPNGGENLAVENDTMITWEGILPSDTVSIEYSTDGGKTWIKITDSASGLKYKWKIPNTPSNNCLLRIRQVKDTVNFTVNVIGMGTAHVIALSPDEKKICSGGGRGIIYIWDTQTGLKIDSIDQNPGYISSIAWSPDGSKIVCGAIDSVLNIWDANSYTLIKELHGFIGVCWSNTVAWSPDGKYIAGGNGDNTIKIWDANTGTLLRTLSGHTNNIRTISWNSAGTKIASGSQDFSVKIWNASTGSLLYTLPGHTDYVYSVAWSPDDSKVISGSGDETIKIWNANTGSLIKNYTAHNGYISSVSYSSDGLRFVSGSSDGTFKIWDANTYELKLTMYVNSVELISLLWDSAGTKIYCCNSEGIKIWDAKTGSLLKSFLGHNPLYRALSWRPDRSILAVGSRYYNVDFVELKTYRIIKSLNYNSDYSVCWSPDGSRIAVGYADSKIFIWDYNSGNIIDSLLGHIDEVRNVSWSPDGSMIASASKDNTIKVWDASTGSLLKTLTGHTDIVFSVSWSPDGSKIVSGSGDKTIKIWDVASGSTIKTLLGHTSNVFTISWSYDGKKIASGSYDDNIKIWDAVTGDLIYTLTGHTHDVYSVSWNPESTRLLSGSYDRTAKIWDINTGKLIITLYGHNWNVNAVAWSSNPNILATAGRDGTIRIWNIFEPQEDTSDSLWSIIEPKLTSLDVNMGQHCANPQEPKAQLITDYITNNSQVEIRVDSITISGKDAADFEVYYMNMSLILQPAEKTLAKFMFNPKTIGVKTADINIYHQAGIQKQKIRGEGIDCGIEVIGNIIDFGKVRINKIKDSLQAVTIKNKSTIPINITSTKHNLPNAVDFSTLAGGGPFTLQPGSIARMNLRFAPKVVGRTCGTLLFYYNNLGSPASVLLLGEGITSDCDESAFEYIDFNSADGLNFNGTAFQMDKYIRLTKTEFMESGAVWRHDLIPVSQGFTTTFKFRFTEGSNVNTNEGSAPGADGIVFVIQNDNPYTNGINGGGIGYHSIPNSLAVEFDTFANDSSQFENYNDPNGNHIAVQSKGKLANTSYHGGTATLGMAENPILIKADGTIYYVKIDYREVGNSLRIFLDTVKESNVSPTLVIDDLNLAALLDLENNLRAYVGFTAATGSAWENHDIMSWYFCPKITVSVEEDEILRVSNNRGLICYPNPAAETAVIEFEIKEYGFANLFIINPLGEKIKTILSGKQNLGWQTTKINTKDLPTGTYFIILQTPTETRTQKLEIVR
ncbi:MAG: Choice-of-anchor protein [Bacteroidota bacterium]|nr:Choice-of-anchor protein [Bacteroidota bacterium]